MKWLSRSLVVLLGLLTLGVAFAALALWLLGSEAGTSWVFHRILARAGSALTVGRTSGTFLGGFVLEDVRVRLSRDELDIDRLELSWDADAARSRSSPPRRVALRIVASRHPPRRRGGRPCSSSRSRSGSQTRPCRP
jgi:autotransporter translocation and assembly factor TamB